MNIGKLLTGWLEGLFRKKKVDEPSAEMNSSEFPDWQPVDEWYVHNLLTSAEAGSRVLRDERLHEASPIAVVTIDEDFSSENNGGVFCPVHRWWEPVRSFDGLSQLTTDFGCIVKGRIIPLKLSRRGWNNCERKENLAALGWHIIQNEPFGKLTVYTEVGSLEFDRKYNEQGKTIEVQVRPVIREETYTIDFNGVTIKSSYSKRYFRDDRIYSFAELMPPPVYFPREIETRVLELMKETFKRQFGIAPTYTEVKGYDRIAAYLLYPFDMNLPCLFSAMNYADFTVFYNRIKDLKESDDCPEELKRKRGAGNGWVSIFPRESKDNFHVLCRIFCLKPSKSLRRAYHRNPIGVLVHAAMADLGFRDVNIISAYYDRGEMLGITAPAFLPGDVHGNKIRRQMMDNFYGGNVAFYVSKVLEAKGERSAARALERLVKCYTSSKSDHKIIIEDSLQMYSQYYDDLPPRISNDMIKSGPGKAVHDRLAAFSLSKKVKKEEFSLYPQYRDLECMVGKISIRLVTNTDMLREIGIALANCVVSYASAAAKGDKLIFIGVVEGKTVACIEIRPKRYRYTPNGWTFNYSLYQALGEYNKKLDTEQQTLILRWVREKDISLSCSHLIEGEQLEKESSIKPPVWQMVRKDAISIWKGREEI